MPRSATENALHNQDILHEVFAHVDEPINLARELYHTSAVQHLQRDLLAVARTCKLFCRPALKLLWRDLPSMDALLCALSTSVSVVPDRFARRTKIAIEDQMVWVCPVSHLVVDGKDVLMHGNTQTVIDTITDSERERFADYASFIRTIDLRTKYSVHANVYRHLAQLGAPLVPHLHTICCHHEWSCDVDVIRRFSSPSLHTLVLGSCYVGQPESQPHFLESLEGICAAAPNVQTIIMHGGGGMPAHSLLRGMKHLRVLDLSMTYASIVHALGCVETLANLDSLEELALRDDCDPIQYMTIPLPPRPGFASLQKLTVHSGIQTIRNLFVGLPDLRLKELELLDVPYRHLSEFEDLIQTCRPALRNSLETLSIVYGLDIVSNVLPPDPLISIISPLFSLPHIKNFSLSSYKYTWIVDDSGLRAIAYAWPDLVSLLLSGPWVGGDEPVAPSIHGIADLASRCTGLRTVELSSLEMLHAVRVVEPPYHATANRWPPLGAELPEDRAINNIETGRLVNIMWPLFGVVDSSKEDAFSDKWSAVLREVARVQDEMDKWGLRVQSAEAAMSLE
ncbi:hypothetical protein C8Q72DRAFT_949568 [Fomitopsis betulina]|nr:hypothetical protein C8Q72DRAFT_949568 [Fomitopsis betulina]